MSKGNLKMLTCAERDAYLHIGTLQSHEGWGVESSLTDLDVRFGDARIETTWVKKKVRVQDVRHPALFCEDTGLVPEDVKPCEHYYWEGNDNE